MGLLTEDSLSIRLWEVDLLRGVAVVMMVLFHLVFDLSYFGVCKLDVHSCFWFFFARLTAFLFILLVGVSLTLSRERADLQSRTAGLFRRLLWRGIWIFSLGMVVTAATYFLVGQGFIIFGVLHLIGVSIPLAYPFLRLRRANIIPGLLFILVGWRLEDLSAPYPWLLWLGLAPDGFYSLDYLPLLPWFGVILMGIALGDHLYRGYRRRIALPDLSGRALIRPLAFLGRNSLMIYFLHQPALIALLYLANPAGISFPWH
jgi:uncharacterized membrane protein